MTNETQQQQYNLEEAPGPPFNALLYAPFEIYKGGEATGLYHYCSASLDSIEPASSCRDCPGHPTREGAREHYRKHLLDQDLAFHNEPDEDVRPCAICGIPTSGGASIWNEQCVKWLFQLCPEHQQVSIVDRLFILCDFVTDDIHGQQSAAEKE